MKIILVKKILLTTLLILSGTHFMCSQTNISITIDDVPNTRKFESDKYYSVLLEKLDSLNIPVTIYVNEGLLYKTDSLVRNFELLVDWVERDYTTLGNHTFSHSRYSDAGYASFKEDIEAGEHLLRKLSETYEKPLAHFRFPYNDLGKDSVEHCMIDSTLQSMKYISSPFTVESSDWMFNYIYEYYKAQTNFEKANEIGELYVSKSLEYIHFFDSLSYEKYDRKINQIYLCHDNSINADYLDAIIVGLEKRGFRFISIDEALTDPAYAQEYKYYKKWGVSWMYRWMNNREERLKWMRIEPDIRSIELLFEKLSAEK